ncbi:hypothetical protein [Nodularia sp. NIES-3585]|uniref:hypothetical protein n=1 Tax=Nodularia sp. NIES-3585 TaxID=1973477 RepID=UPI000B5C796A|nr:hypothetical protein [Nodularia sp. NIES-3585]GAX38171.1 hypothetical protein NIES3585_42190 [Nodularia sp. NIES-3585]
MKKPFLSVTKLSVLTVAGISFAFLLIAQPSLAQFNSVDRGTNQNSDPFAAPNSGDLNIMDMIHRANMGSINWNANQQREKLDSTAEDFRARQQRAFQEQQNSNTDSPEKTESE